MATVSSVDKLVENLGNTTGNLANKPKRKPQIKRASSVLIDSKSAPVSVPQISTEDATELDPASIYIDPSINQRIHSNEIRNRDRAFQELRLSLKENGQIQPIMVRPSTRPGFPYELVYGSRRVHGCIAEGLQVKTIIKPMTNEDALATAYIENEERDDYWPIEDARALMCFLENGSGKAPKYRIKKYENCDRATKHRLKDFAALPDEFIECCSNPAALTERNTRSFRSYYRKNRAAVNTHINQISKNIKRHSPVALTSILMNDVVVRRKKAIQFKDNDNNVVVSIHPVKNNNGRLSQSVTFYDAEIESLEDLKKVLSAATNRVQATD